MRIVYIITRMDELGGPQIHVRDFCLRLLAMGHEPIVIAGSSGSLTDELLARSVPVHIVSDLTRSIGLIREIRAVRAVRALLTQIKPDLVSCHSSKAGVVGRLAAYLAGIPAIFTVHGWAFTENVRPFPRAVYTVIEWLMARFCARIITVSDYDRNLGLRAHVAAPGKIVTVHNGMPEYPRKPVPAPDHHVRLMMTARFAPQKDHATLVSALALIRDLPWRLVLAGNGDSAAVAAQIKTLGLGDKITILGQRADISDLLNAADVFVLITHWEGFPRAIVEAMRTGLPVVATRVAGVPESVADGQTGFLVPRQDVASVAAAITRLVQDPALRTRMGAAARTRYEQYFTFERMFARTLAVYRDVTGSQA